MPGVHKLGRSFEFSRNPRGQWAHILGGEDDDGSRLVPEYTDEPGPHRCSVYTSDERCGQRDPRRSPTGIRWDAPPPYLAFLHDLEAK